LGAELTKLSEHHKDEGAEIVRNQEEKNYSAGRYPCLLKWSFWVAELNNFSNLKISEASLLVEYNHKLLLGALRH
jgi:hypothetical protein